MSYTKQQIIEWDIPIENVLNVPIGYEVEFSSDQYFVTSLYRITTFEEVTAVLQGTFYYSLDNGVTWIDFPRGESGQLFTQAYKMRLVVNTAYNGEVFSELQGTIYRIRADLKSVINHYDIASFNSTGFEINNKNNTVYVSGTNKTLYAIDSGLTVGDSINLHSNPLGISVDSSRNIFWQIDRRTVDLKDLQGNLIFRYVLPYDIDV